MRVAELKAVQTDDLRELYKGIGKEHLYEYQMRDCARAAEGWRLHVDGKKRPGGIGEPMIVLPKIVMDHFREANRQLYVDDRKKFYCWLWHRFPAHRGRTGVCPACGK